MLAFILWHWPRPDQDPHNYERNLARFHMALSESRTPGLCRSLVFRAGKAPWLPEGRTAYLDWYLVEGSAGLDPLNEAAVTGPCRLPHDDAARQLDGASSGLYRLRLGETPVEQARFSSWFNKPAGVPLAQFCDALRSLTERSGGNLWTRQMGLAITPELCLLSPGPVEVPADGDVIKAPIDLVWPGRAS